MLIQMEKENEKILQDVSTQLDVIIGLLLDLNGSLSENNLIRNKVSYLVNRGIPNKNISRALGISEKYVSKEKSLINKTKQGENNDGREEII